jgi:repressor LexA
MVPAGIPAGADPLNQLTAKQRSIYDFIRDEIQRRGYAPTVRDIGKEFGISSPNGVMCHLKALEKKGLIERAPDKARAIRVHGLEGEDPRGVPLVGVVAAGVMHEAIAEDERFDFDQVFPRDRLMALRVTGDSMIEAHIDEGDLVLVRRQNHAEPGQMVVAQTQGETTLKYWHPEGGRIRLQPANATMAPIYVEQAEVLGVVVGVVRKLA